MQMLLNKDDLNIEGQRLYNNGHFTGITVDMLDERLKDSFEKASRVSLLLPNEKSRVLKNA